MKKKASLYIYIYCMFVVSLLLCNFGLLGSNLRSREVSNVFLNPKLSSIELNFWDPIFKGKNVKTEDLKRYANYDFLKILGE